MFWVERTAGASEGKILAYLGGKEADVEGAVGAGLGRVGHEIREVTKDLVGPHRLP